MNNCRPCAAQRVAEWQQNHQAACFAVIIFAAATMQYAIFLVTLMSESAALPYPILLYIERDV